LDALGRLGDIDMQLPQTASSRLFTTSSILADAANLIMERSDERLGP
jgi:hypothetical protein